MIPSNPPRPRYALNVGIVGHRPNRLPQSADAMKKLELRIAEALDVVRDAALLKHSLYSNFFRADEPTMSLVSALAEGADSIAANHAINVGYTLYAVLPFPKAEYCSDFSRSAEKTFQGLVAHARSVLELPGKRNEQGKSYEAAGLVVLDTSDILIAVWDGGAAAGRGGTSDFVVEAARRGMPIIHIDAGGDKPSQILWKGLNTQQNLTSHIEDCPTANLEERIEVVVDALIRPPSVSDELNGLNRFFSEQCRSWIWRQSFPLLMAAFGVRWPSWSDIKQPKPRRLAAGVAFLGASPLLAQAYGWSDGLSVRFAQLFRSTFTDNFLFTAFAVIAAAMSLIALSSWVWAIVELCFVGWVLLNTRTGLRRQWHQRWVEPREVAERLRVAMPMTLLGTRPIGPYGELPTWTAWYVRALLREAGLQSGVLDNRGLDCAISAIRELIAAQVGYQYLAAERFSKLNNRLRVTGEVVLIVTIATIVLHLAFIASGAWDSLQFWHAAHSRAVEDLATAVSTAMPAIGAAFYGIRTIGDFEGNASRARRMHDQLVSLSKTFASIPLNYHTARAVSQAAAEIMLGDVASWRLAAESRSLSVPG